MELREPPRQSAGIEPDAVVRWLLILNLVVLVVVAILILVAPGRRDSSRDTVARSREVAGKLRAAGALDEAAALYEQYLADSKEPSEARARIAFTLGNDYLESGRNERALRWFYEADSLAGDELSDELGPKIVHTLERLGRYHAAQAALESRVALQEAPAQRAEDDPVVARIGADEIHRSEFERALEDLSPEVAGGVNDLEARRQLLNRYVGEELLWRKAKKLELDRDPEVQRQHTLLLKQLAVAKFLEEEIVGKIEVDESDLRNFFEANRERYQSPAEGDQTVPERSFEEVRPLVERDYRLRKIQSTYEDVVQTELATSDVELFPQNLTGDPGG